MVGEDRRVTFSRGCGKFARKLARPPDVAVEALAREFENRLSSLEVGHDRAFVLRARGHKIGILKAPRYGADTSLVKVGVGGNRILGVPQVPNVDALVLVIIVSDDELGWNHRIPDDLSLHCSSALFTLASLGAEVVILAGRGLFWLGELENRFAGFQIPHDDFAVFGGAGQNVLNDTIPTNRSDSVALVEIGLAWFEFFWLLHLADVLNKDFTAARRQ